MIGSGWRWLFYTAAGFNTAVGGALMLAPDAVHRALNLSLPVHPFYTRLAGELIAAFGFTYWLVARDPVRNRDMALAGAVGKLGAVATALACWATGLAPWQVAAAVSADLIFALAFLRFRAATSASIRRPAL